MKSLALSGCELTECPNWIGELTNLTFISFASNQLTSIPESVGALVDLEYAYFSENELSEIPESLSNLKSLKFIYIKKGNSLSKAEKEKVDGLFKHTKVF